MGNIKKTISMKQTLITAGIVFCIFVFSGCNSRAKNIETPVSMPGNFSAGGSETLPSKWWEAFNDAKLNCLIKEAIGNNFTILAAWDRLSQSEQIAVKEGADLLPEINYNGSASRLRQEINGSKSYSTNYSAGLSLSYEVDLWNKIKSAEQAAILDAESAYENVYAAAITLSSEVAKTWYKLAEAKLKETVLNKQLETNKKVLEVIILQFSKSQVGAADVYRQKQLVESTNGELIQTRENIVLLQHQLSILLGRRPKSWWKDEAIELITLPELPKTGIPSETIKNRPDVLSAYKLILAADERVAEAIANQYPSISIFSNAETSSDKISDLFDDWLANIAGNAVGPLFDGGVSKAEVERTKEIVSERINNYGQIILQAIKETEDALNQEKYQRQYVKNLNAQLSLARKVYERTEQSYIKGLLDYIRVLDSLVSQQNLEIRELNSRRVLIERRIDLCKSIAGSWELNRPGSLNNGMEIKAN